MRPEARLQAAAEILDRFAAETGSSADRLLKEWGRASRFAGSKDRAAVADLVYGGLRRWRSLAGGLGESGRARVLASLVVEGGMAALDALDFTVPHAPEPPSSEERGRLMILAEQGLDAVLSAEEAAPTLRLDWPDWLWPELARTEAPEPEAAALRERAAFDLRANTLKTDRDAALRLLHEAGVTASAGPLSPLAIRVEGGAKVTGLDLYRDGLVEPQDAASQAVGLIAASMLGEDPSGRVALDFCAGGGGKTLTLAAATGNRARLLAHDVAPQRMKDLPERLRRAGAKAERVDAKTLTAFESAFDLVLVDAPCSGSGAWARNPDAKWRLTPERLRALNAAQDDALEQAARYVRPGGALVYATCSLLPVENTDRVATFLSRQTGFASAPLAPFWRAAGVDAPEPKGSEASFTPARHSADGFFVAAMRRKS